MGIFSRQTSGSADLRDRDYVLTGCPLVAQDDLVVLVDVTVRLAVRRAAGDDLALGYDPANEPAIHAVCLVVLRLLAAEVPSAELLTGRARVTQALEQGLAYAPIGSGVRPRVLSVEVGPYDAARADLRHEFRVVDS